MTVENSELNTSGPLASSNAGLTGGSGDGNRLLVADLARGYTDVGGEHMMLPSFGVQEGMSAVPSERGGFLTRPAGWER